ncbi:hypothetical protein CBS101457_003203 [Exobasidium rhododendri]|nr:hypothetical protein CBS101457_003203 [Exobasidium rhododendri]
MSINVDGVPTAVASFLRQFYSLSDSPAEHQAYVDQFQLSSDGFLQIGPMKRATKSDDILAWRHKAWELISTRKHTVYGVFSKTDGDTGTEYMLHGRVDYEKKDGEKSGATWAGRMVFDENSIQTGHPKISFYQVWITVD